MPFLFSVSNVTPDTYADATGECTACGAFCDIYGSDMVVGSVVHHGDPCDCCSEGGSARIVETTTEGADGNAYVVSLLRTEA